MGGLKPAILTTANKRYSDTDLLEKNLVSSDPEQLENLSKKMPDNYKEADIEFWYDLTPPKGVERNYIWCAHDEKETHWIGYVMKTPNNTRFLIGKDCGKKIYGLQFNITSRSFDGLRSRQLDLRRWNSVVASLPKALKELTDFSQSAILTQFEDTKSNLRLGMSELYSALVKTLRNEGKLVIHERVRDYAAEANRTEGLEQEQQQLTNLRSNMTLSSFQKAREVLKQKQAKAGQKAIYKTIEIERGRLSGRDFLRKGPSVKERMQQIVRSLRATYEEIRTLKTDNLDDKKLKSILTKIKKLISEIETEIGRLNLANDFFEIQNLTIIASWASEMFGASTYISSGRKLTYQTDSGDIDVSLPDDYKMPVLKDFDVLRLAFTQGKA